MHNPTRPPKIVCEAGWVTVATRTPDYGTGNAAYALEKNTA